MDIQNNDLTLEGVRIGLRSMEELESGYGRSMAIMAMDLRLPVIVSEVLNGKQDYDSRTHSHIEDTVLDMDPHSALLGLALSSKLLLLRYGYSEGEFEPDQHILLFRGNLETMVASHAPAWIEAVLNIEQPGDQNDLAADVQDQSIFASLNADFVSLAIILEKLEEALKPVCLEAARLAENLHYIAEYFISETDGEVDDFCRKIALAIDTGRKANNDSA